MTKNEKLFMKECDDEIQKLWKPKVGDVIYDKNYDEIGSVYAINEIDKDCKILNVSWLDGNGLSDFTPDENTIWLPSLSQIIEMIEKRHSGKWDIHRVIEEKNTDYLMKIWSGDYVNFFTEGATPDLCAIIALKQVIKGER